MSVREYIGARYVPIFADPIQWDPATEYESLTIVTDHGASYVSRVNVPAGIAIDNDAYWVEWSNFNAQLQHYIDVVNTFDERIDDAEDAIDAINARFPIASNDIADDAVTAAKIAAGAVGSSELATDSVTSAKIASGAVGSSELATDSVTSAKIASGAVGTSAIADKAVTNEKIENYFTQPNFVVADRFIYGEAENADNVTAAQAGCVFTQGGVDYWAQIMYSSDTGLANDHLIIRNMSTHATICDIKAQFGHGYTISYNPTTKQLLTQDVESTPARIIIVNVANPSSAYIQQTINIVGVNIDNPCWYDSTHFIAAGNGTNVWTVYDLTLTETERYTLDLHGYTTGNGYIFQSMCWDKAAGKCYIGTTQPDGIIICDIDSSAHTGKMIDFIACKPYYRYIYMREMEMACRNGNYMYINQFDTVDGLLVVALLKWDMVNGTIPDENSKFIQATGNIGFTVDYDNGSLMPHASSAGQSRYKLAGDAITEARGMAAGQSRVYLTFASDYPHIVWAKSTKLAIENSKAVSIKGLYFINCDVIWNPSYAITVEPVINISSTYYCGVYCRNTQLLNTSSLSSFITLINPESLADARGVYMETSEYTALRYTCTFTASDWFRWDTLIVSANTAISDATVFNCAVITRS